MKNNLIGMIPIWYRHNISIHTQKTGPGGNTPAYQQCTLRPGVLRRDTSLEGEGSWELRRNEGRILPGPLLERVEI